MAQRVVVAVCALAVLVTVAAAWLGQHGISAIAERLPLSRIERQQSLLAAAAALDGVRVDLQQRALSASTGTDGDAALRQRLSMAAAALDAAALAPSAKGAAPQTEPEDPLPALSLQLSGLATSLAPLPQGAEALGLATLLAAGQGTVRQHLATETQVLSQGLRQQADTLRVLGDLVALALLLGAAVLASVVWRSYIRTRERAAAEASLTAAKHQAEQASRAKSDFLANMSHELRTPLNAILGFSEMMRDNYLDPEDVRPYRTYAGCIHDAGAHLLSIIEDILDLTKIEAGRLQLKIRRHKVEDTMARVMQVVGQRARDGGVALEVDAVPPGLTVRADERALRQILINVMGNAVKFTPRRGTVKLAVEARPDAVAFRITDTGCGIAEQDLQRVLVPFEQCASSSYARSHEGTGLGLPIAKALVELHGGKLVLTSRLGEGTAVELVFPDSIALDDSLPDPLPVAAATPEVRPSAA